MEDDQEYYDLQARNRKSRVFPGRERYRETTLPVGDHRDIMSVAYDKLLVIFRRITAHCTAGIDDDVNQSTFHAVEKIVPTSPASATIAAVI